MNPPSEPANAVSRARLLYDGECGFCRLWVGRWQQVVGETAECVPFQDNRVAQWYPSLPLEQLQAAVHFVDRDGVIYRGAEAVFRLLATNPGWRWCLRLYQASPPAAHCAERCYRWIAAHRGLLGRLTRTVWGPYLEPPRYFLVRRAFLVLLAVIYLIAFTSLWAQVSGLIGENGIEPAANLMAQANQAVTAEGIGPGRYHLLPTLCWFGASDAFLKFQCAAGTVISMLLMAGIAPPLCLALLWLLYLSLTTVGGDFLAFQWDNLLLEAGLLGVFLGPFQWWARPSRERPPSKMAMWLLRLLLFKLMFLSGVVKLASGDPAWRSLTALTCHYQTQPLPNTLAWHLQHLPVWFHQASCVVMFGIELGAPFLIFGPRRVRLVGASALAALQVLILLTGNYTFFNWLTLALCPLLLDDFVLARVLPQKLVALYTRPSALPVAYRRWLRGLAVAPVAILFVSISAIQVARPLHPLPPWTSPVVEAYRWVSPFRSINSYGLFAVMTTERPEIIVEGSNDGRDWQEYEFRYKPGALKRRPPFVAPYQPRLDWQMWFAALGEYRQNPWFINFCIRLLQGSPEVLALLEKNPFPAKPPRYIRARLYDYQFTTAVERQQTGAWWKRKLRGEYLPAISLKNVQEGPVP